MTPLEKAIELIEKFKVLDNDWKSQGNLYCVKQYALITVEEILKTNPSYVYWETYKDEQHSSITFWNEVKNELEKM